MREHAPGFLEAEVSFVPSFYSVAAMDGRTAEHLQKAVYEYSRNEIFMVMCIGHNKGWEEASMFSGASIELKTCNAARAVEDLNGKKFDDKEWYVGKAQKKSERELELKGVAMASLTELSFNWTGFISAMIWVGFSGTHATVKVFRVGLYMATPFYNHHQEFVGLVSG